MVDRQIKTFDVTDSALLARILEVPRELFLPAELKPLAYSDSSLQLKPGAPGQTQRTLLAPLILARLIQGARVMESDKALVVAAGVGYSTALLCGARRRRRRARSRSRAVRPGSRQPRRVRAERRSSDSRPARGGSGQRGSVRRHSGRRRGRRQSRSAARAIEEWRPTRRHPTSPRRNRQGRSL